MGSVGWWAEQGRCLPPKPTSSPSSPAPAAAAAARCRASQVRGRAAAAGAGGGRGRQDPARHPEHRPQQHGPRHPPRPGPRPAPVVPRRHLVPRRRAAGGHLLNAPCSGHLSGDCVAKPRWARGPPRPTTTTTTNNNNNPTAACTPFFFRLVSPHPRHLPPSRPCRCANERPPALAPDGRHRRRRLGGVTFCSSPRTSAAGAPNTCTDSSGGGECCGRMDGSFFGLRHPRRPGPRVSHQK